MIYPQISRSDVIKKMIFPSKMSNELAEFVGMHIGDGHMAYHKDQGEYIFQICGHQIKDKIYYDTTVRSLLKKLFGINKEPKFFLSRTYGYQIYSKGLFYFMYENFDLPDGKKTHTVSIPKIFFKESKYLPFVLRGIIDTDFYLYVKDEKRPSLGAWFASKPLIMDLQRAFKILDIKSSVFLDDYYTDKRTGRTYHRHRISVPKSYFHKWQSVIGTSHPLLACKYNNWIKGTNLTDKDVLNNPQMLDKFATAPVV